MWVDLPAVQLHDAMAFYEGLLTWKFRQMENSPLADYVMIEAEGIIIGGLRKVATRPAPISAGHAPIPYFTVPNLCDAIARAKELGAEIIGARVDLGKSRGAYQWLRDREDNLIGLWALQ